MRIRIGRLDLNLSWEYLVAPLLVLLALTILVVWQADHEKGETIRVMATQTPAASETSTPGAVPQDDSLQDESERDGAANGSQNEPQEAVKVNINKAGMDELMTLPYIGEVKARAIIAYREEHGPFKTPEDLLNVKGIGPKTLERLRDRITVE